MIADPTVRAFVKRLAELCLRDMVEAERENSALSDETPFEGTSPCVNVLGLLFRKDRLVWGDAHSLRAFCVCSHGAPGGAPHEVDLCPCGLSFDDPVDRFLREYESCRENDADCAWFADLQLPANENDEEKFLSALAAACIAHDWTEDQLRQLLSIGNSFNCCCHRCTVCSEGESGGCDEALLEACDCHCVLAFTLGDWAIMLSDLVPRTQMEARELALTLREQVDMTDMTKAARPEAAGAAALQLQPFP